MEELYFTGIGAGAGAGSGDGFFRIAAATPAIRVADVEGNAQAILDCVKDAASRGVGALALPELCLTGYTCADLFFDRTLLRACENCSESLACRNARATHPVYGRPAGGAWRRHLQLRCRVLRRPALGPYGKGEYSQLHASSMSVAGSRRRRSTISIRPTRAAALFPWVHVSCTAALILGWIRSLSVSRSAEDLWVPEPPSISMAAQGGSNGHLEPVGHPTRPIGKGRKYRRDLVRGAVGSPVLRLRLRGCGARASQPRTWCL